MSLLDKRCAQCGKELPENSIRKDGKDFCCAECVAKYDEGHKAGSHGVCEFC